MMDTDRRIQLWRPALLVDKIREFRAFRIDQIDNYCNRQKRCPSILLRGDIQSLRWFPDWSTMRFWRCCRRPSSYRPSNRPSIPRPYHKLGWMPHRNTGRQLRSRCGRLCSALLESCRRAGGRGTLRWPRPVCGPPCVQSPGRNKDLYSPKTRLYDWWDEG